MQCITPFYLKEHQIGVPCGKCPACLKKRVSSWSFRLMQQDKVSNLSLFVTLTYNYQNIPISKNGYKTVDKKDLQKFIKRLRKIQHGSAKSDIKYFGVAEYGEKTCRPHYHLIIYNADYESIKKAWCNDGRPMGHVHFGTVSGASVGYTLKYILKGGFRLKHKNDDRQPTWQVMSKGLGLNYLTPQIVKWHKEVVTISHDPYIAVSERMYVNVEGNKKAAMPRYYKEKIFNKYQRKLYGQIAFEKMQNKNLADSNIINIFESQKALYIKTERDSIKGETL